MIPLAHTILNGEFKGRTIIDANCPEAAGIHSFAQDRVKSFSIHSVKCLCGCAPGNFIDRFDAYSLDGFRGFMSCGSEGCLSGHSLDRSCIDRMDWTLETISTIEMRVEAASRRTRRRTGGMNENTRDYYCSGSGDDGSGVVYHVGG